LFSLLFQVNANDHCPPIGPLHEKCKNKTDDTASVSSVVSYSETNENAIPESTIGNNTRQMGPLSIIMLLAALIAMISMIGAVLLGQRHQTVVHPLKGSIVRRKNLFQSFVDCALCDSIPTSSSNDSHNPRHLEMTYSKDDYETVRV
jgi:hypothetical protein